VSSIQERIEAVLASAEPDVEVLLAEVIAGDRLRVFIDHPDGVSLDLCTQVSHHLDDLRTDYALEVSSPGAERPLSKPEHFRRFLGRRAKIRVRGDGASPRAWSPHDGRRSFTGELMSASDSEVTVAADSGVVSIPYAEIHRSHLVKD
jgi:ribosome maturation factor RimP